ncbi:hypothetical protein [Serratia symbiotica]|nr:hypothetical protein [Serratia symbiotica]
MAGVKATASGQRQGCLNSYGNPGHPPQARRGNITTKESILHYIHQIDG